MWAKLHSRFMTLSLIKRNGNVCNCRPLKLNWNKLNDFFFYEFLSDFRGPSSVIDDKITRCKYTYYYFYYIFHFGFPSIEIVHKYFNGVFLYLIFEWEVVKLPVDSGKLIHALRVADFSSYNLRVKKITMFLVNFCIIYGWSEEMFGGSRRCSSH